MVDYVIPFVNGNDPIWREKYNKYANKNKDWSNNESRYRDWDTLKYLLRSIEKNMPWVNNIFIVLSIGESQIPQWLKQENKKIHIVYDWEIVPKEQLPVFNSNVIDLYIPNIKGLSEKYLYACDDYIITKPLKPEDFFTEDGKVKLKMGLYKYPDGVYARTLANGANLITPELVDVKKENNKILHYIVPYANHTVTPHLKSENLKLLQQHKDKIEQSLTKFRSDKNITWLIYPLNLRKKGLLVPGNVTVDCRIIRNIRQAYSIDTNSDVIVLNDSYVGKNYDVAKNILTTQMQNMFPKKSEFEV